jgi:hypothetical protein
VARKTYSFSSEQLRYRPPIPMTPEMRDFLAELSSRTKAKGGRYLDRSQILRGLIQALMRLEGQVDWSSIRDEEELVRRLVAAFRKR